MTRPMSLISAALLVLSEADRPMTVKEIASAIADGRLASTSGKTPVASISAQLYVASSEGRFPGLERTAAQGPTRARRGSVRWLYRPK